MHARRLVTFVLVGGCATTARLHDERWNSVEIHSLSPRETLTLALELGSHHGCSFSFDSLEENVTAAGLRLAREDLAALT